MKYRSGTSRVLIFFAILGLVLNPLVRQAIAMPADTMNIPVESSTPEMEMSMQGDMSCCQEQSPTPDCTTDCPFIALCMMSNIANIPIITPILLPVKLEDLLLPVNDTDFASLNHDPPLRPPPS